MPLDRAALAVGAIRLASGGADAADLLGGAGVHHEMTASQRFIGLGGAIVGLGVGLWGAARRPQRTTD